MEISNILDRENAQTKLDEYFNNFREGNIGGSRFSLMPSKANVPLIKKVGYDRTRDIFEIVFEYRQNVQFKKNDDIIFIEDNAGRLVGIQVLNPRKSQVKNIQLEILADLDAVIRKARVRVEKEPTPKQIANLDIEERKIDFMKDLIKNQFDKLVKES